MTIERAILNIATHYHANLIDMHNALHALGLRSDDQAEEFNKRHVMKIIDMYERRGYSITKQIRTLVEIHQGSFLSTSKLQLLLRKE